MTTADQRDDVRRMAGQGESRRAIARQTGLTRYMVDRVLAEVAEVADQSAAVADQGGRPVDSRRRPVAGDVLAVPVDDHVADHLAVLMATGCTRNEAIEYALATLADSYLAAIAAGLVVDGDPLTVDHVQIRPTVTTSTAVA